MKTLIIAFLAAGLCQAAEPDWQRLESYAVDLLQRYLRIDTTNPPGNTTASAALLKSELEKNGFEVQLFEAGKDRINLVTRLAGKDRNRKPLLLLSHMDVVPVDRKQWSVDPFGGILKDGWLWGRGALDMKSTGIMQVVSLIAMKQAGIVPPRDIVLLASCDEELGGRMGVMWMLEKHPEVMDVEYVLDEGGFLSRDVISPAKLVAGISVGEKQIAWLRIRAKGTAGHGSQPIPENANVILLKALARAMDLPADTKPNQIVEGMRRELGTFSENKFTGAIQKTTMTLTTLRSGVGDPPKANVIPSIAEATIDCRLLPGVNSDEFVSDIRARINDPRVTVETLQPDSLDPRPTSPATPLFEALSAAIRKHHPEAVVTPILIPWGTDSNRLRARGIKAYGIFPMVLDAGTIATFHSDQERMPVDEFRKGLRIYFDVLRSNY